MVAEIQAPQAAHPDIVALRSIGKSYQGRDLWVAKVSDNVAADEAEPEVLFDGLHHAREHLSLEQTLAILRWLTDGYGTDQRITDIVNSREIWIVFAVNPDGAEYDLTGIAVSRLAQEPPAEPELDVDRHRPQPELRLPLGVLRRLIEHEIGRPRTTGRAPSRRPRRARSATSWPAAGSAGASRSRPPSRSTPPASRSCGRTATPRPTSRAT